MGLDMKLSELEWERYLMWVIIKELHNHLDKCSIIVMYVFTSTVKLLIESGRRLLHD